MDGLGAGGAELLLAEFARAAPQAGLNFTVASLTGERDRPAAVRLREAGIEPELVPISSLLSPLDLRRVRRHIRGVAPDIVHTHLGSSDFMGGIAGRSLGVPVVSTLHAHRWDGTLADRARAQMTAVVRRHCADRVIAVSDGARRDYLERVRERPERVVTIHNGLSAEPRPGTGARVRAGLGIGPEALVITMLSAIRPEKAHPLGIEAAAEVMSRHPDVVLLVVGEGPLLGEVKRSAQKLGDRARVLGHRDDVMEVLDATDVLLHPSHFDAFPTAILEAMCASVPTVATAVGGIPEIVEHGVTGVLVDPPPRRDSLAEALVGLADDRPAARTLGFAARERFEREFSADLWAQRTRALYAKVLGDPRGLTARR